MIGSDNLVFCGEFDARNFKLHRVVFFDGCYCSGCVINDIAFGSSKAGKNGLSGRRRIACQKI
jgi:hypothetical protein